MEVIGTQSDHIYLYIVQGKPSWFPTIVYDKQHGCSPVEMNRWSHLGSPSTYRYIHVFLKFDLKIHMIRWWRSTKISFPSRNIRVVIFHLYVPLTRYFYLSWYIKNTTYTYTLYIYIKEWTYTISINMYRPCTGGVCTKIQTPRRVLPSNPHRAFSTQQPIRTFSLVRHCISAFFLALRAKHSKNSDGCAYHNSALHYN
jgi:hypothetical protein